MRGLRIILGLLATILASIPEPPRILGLSVTPTVTERTNDEKAALLISAFLRAAEEREEAEEDAPFAGARGQPFRVACPTWVAASGHARAATPRFCGSHYPTGPPEA